MRQQEYLESTVSRPLQTLFYFHFKPQDLQEYIADLYRIAEVGFKQAQLNKNDYLLKYPEECMNGKPLKSTWTQAYKVFCREQNLQPWNLKNQQEFRMRIRAAWKRLVAGWNFIFPDKAKIQKCRAELARYQEQLQTTDSENQTKLRNLMKDLEIKIEAEFEKGKTPDLKDVKEYLESMHIKEVALKKTGNASGPQTTVEDVPEQEWSILDENKTIDRSRRVLVPGAPMRAANPYLVSPR